MRKWVLVVYYEQKPLVVIPLETGQTRDQVLDLYGRDYVFEREKLSGVVLEMIHSISEEIQE